MIETKNAGLGDLLLLFLYIEILSMVKGSALGTREIPIRTPVALAIVAVARYIVVDVEHMTPTFMLMTAGAILVLVCALWVLSHLKFRYLRFPHESTATAHSIRARIVELCGCSSMAEQ